MKRIDVNYADLPTDFFDHIIYYEKIYPSGLLDVDDQLKMITDTGEQYILFSKEIREGYYDRVIPFLKPVIIRSGTGGCHFGSAAPEGWSYYYYFHHGYIVRSEVYEIFEESVPKTHSELQKLDKERWNWRQEELHRHLEEYHNVKINKEKTHIIHMNELIPIYNNRYAPEGGRKCITIEKICEVPEIFWDRAVLFDVEYRTGEHWINGCEIGIYAEKGRGYFVDCRFGNEDNDYPTEKAFLEAISKNISFVADEESGEYCFNKTNGKFVLFEISNWAGWYRGCFIRKDVYDRFYENVFKDLEQSAGTRPFFFMENWDSDSGK